MQLLGSASPLRLFDARGTLTGALEAGREKVRVARALQALPAISAAFRSGELSYSKVRAVTRVATPACEETLLEMARHATAAQTERIVRNYRIAMSLDSDRRQVAPDRALTCYWDEYGCLTIRGRLAAERGGSTVDRFQATVSVSAESLAADDEPGSEPPAIDDGLAISAERARGLCCDGSVVPILESASGEVLSIGRRSRTVPPALRRALKRRDGGCRFPGCDQHRWVDAHHILHWAHGGETKLDNLVLLCRRHHSAVHEGGYHIRRLHTEAGVDFQFVHSPGWIVPNSAEDLTTGSWRTLIDDVCAETPGIGATTMLPRCDFRPPDYDHIAWWMVNFMKR